MIIKGILLSLFCFLLGLTALISFVIAIVRRRDKPTRNRSILIASIFTVLSLSLGVYISVKMLYVIKKESERVVDSFAPFLAEHLSGRHPDSEYMDSLKNRQPTDRIIPNSFYYCAGIRDYYRMPLIYPYSLVAIDLLYGTVYDESKVENVFVSSDDSNPIVMGITDFAFDGNYLWAKIESFTDLDSPTYVLLDFKSGNLKKFETEEQITEYVKQMGVDTTCPMITPEEYYWKF